MRWSVTKKTDIPHKAEHSVYSGACCREAVTSPQAKGIPMRTFLSVFLILFLSASFAGPAVAAPATSASVASVNCSERTNPAECDTDGDGITDALEKQICGTATCATGREDRDGDGIPDWVEFRACGTAECADPTADEDRDGIPDFAELLTCGSPTCSTGREDADGDKIADWIEFVICGDRTCANGSEDYDADGISDAKQLAACVVAFDVTTPALWVEDPATMTLLVGQPDVIYEFVWWPIWVGAGVGLLGLMLLGLALWARRRRNTEYGSTLNAERGDGEVFSDLFGTNA